MIELLNQIDSLSIALITLIMLVSRLLINVIRVVNQVLKLIHDLRSEWNALVRRAEKEENDHT